jgi:FkbM family methyltransferase
MNKALTETAKEVLLHIARRPLAKKIAHRVLYLAKEKPEWSSVLRDPEMQFLGQLLKSAHVSNSQIFQDIWVLFETEEKRRGFFVEFGATNGKHISNSYLLERSYGWDGILAEPAPIWHQQLSEARTCEISHKCVWAKTGETRKFRQTKDPALSTLDDFAERDLHAPARTEADEIHVETISLNDLLVEHKAPRTIDYMSIDTEGSELSILESFDFDKYDVRLVSVEHNFTANEAELDRLMIANGYERRFREFTFFDAWYRKRDSHVGDP